METKATTMTAARVALQTKEKIGVSSSNDRIINMTCSNKCVKEETTEIESKEQRSNNREK
jgi:hypothetical protein